VVLGQNRRADIIVRENESLLTLAKNFVASFGLKKEFINTIHSNLENLVANVLKN
jgi:hypothetical protein